MCNIVIRAIACASRGSVFILRFLCFRAVSFLLFFGIRWAFSFVFFWIPSNLGYVG